MENLNEPVKIKINQYFRKADMVKAGDINSKNKEELKNDASKRKNLRKKLTVLLDKFLGKAVRTAVYLLVFFLPLLVIPFTYEIWEFNKQYLLIFLVFLGFVFWLIKAVFIRREIRIRKNTLDFAVFVFVVVAAISTIFSIDPTVSVLGFYGRASGSFLEILSLGILYFLITANFQKTDNLIKTFFISSFFVILTSSLFLAGILAKILPGSAALDYDYAVFLSKTFNMVSSSTQLLNLYLGVVVIFVLGFVFLGNRSKKNLDLPDRKNEYKNSAGDEPPEIEKGSASYSFAGLLLFLSAAFLIVLNAYSFFGAAKPEELSAFGVLDRKTSMEIAKNEMLSGNTKNILIGSGPSTFLYDFSRYKPEEFSAAKQWSLRFIKAESELAEKITTTGAVGIISYFLLILLSAIAVFVSIKKRNMEPAPAFLAVFVLFLGQFFFWQNIALTFTFWLFLSIVSCAAYVPQTTGELKASIAGKAIKISFGGSSPWKWTIMGSSAAIILLIAGLFYTLSNFYQADLFYKKALADADRGNNDFVIEQLNQAVSLNPYRYEYHISLTMVYLRKINQKLNTPREADDETKNAQEMGILTDKAIKEARTAVDLAPQNVIAQEILAVVYRDIGPLTQGALEWAKKSFIRALELEPANPALLTELGKVRMSIAAQDKTKEVEIDAAMVDFQKALRLKPDYLDAELQMALALEKKGDAEAAVKRLENIEISQGEEIARINPEILFQLGRLYYNSGNVDQALLRFQKIIAFYPNHSNTRYSLGLVYEKKGMLNEAKAEFEKVLELNPGNKDIESKIKEIESSQ